MSMLYTTKGQIWMAECALCRLPRYQMEHKVQVHGGKTP